MAEKEAAKRMWYPGSFIGMPVRIVDLSEYEGLKARVRELEERTQKQRELLEAKYKLAVDV